MVKVGEYSVKLEEVENAINMISEIKEYAVVPAMNGENVQWIDAYIVLNDAIKAGLATTISIKKKLSETLRQYMIPQRLIYVDELPRTVNGEIDRSNLIEKSKVEGSDNSSVFVPVASDEALIEFNMTRFEEGQGYRFDMNNPKTFNEKLQWYKFNYYDDRMSKCVDKLGFKTYAEERIGKDCCVKTLGIWDDVAKLEKDWENLPDQFCLKSNCMEMNMGVMIITDKSKCDFNQIKEQVGKWVKKKYTLVNSMYRAYKNVEPRIFAEEYIGSNNSLVDYKFYCFDGKPYCINATTRSFSGDEILDEGIAFYDTEWNVLKGNVAGRLCRIVEKPEHLEEMLKMAGKLSDGFPFVRIDFYCTNQRVYAGELEFFPGAGYGKYEPFEFDMELGNQFVLPRTEKK